MTSHACIVCGTKLFTDENLSACAHGLRCEICTTQNAECVACVKIEDADAELVPNSPERLAMIARVMDGHTSLPLGASIPGTKAPQGYWPLRDLLLRKIAQGRALGMFRAELYTTEANHQNTVAHAGELFAQLSDDFMGRMADEAAQRYEDSRESTDVRCVW